MITWDFPKSFFFQFGCVGIFVCHFLFFLTCGEIETLASYTISEGLLLIQKIPLGSSHQYLVSLTNTKIYSVTTKNRWRNKNQRLEPPLCFINNWWRLIVSLTTNWSRPPSPLFHKLGRVQGPCDIRLPKTLEVRPSILGPVSSSLPDPRFLIASLPSLIFASQTARSGERRDGGHRCGAAPRPSAAPPALETIHLEEISDLRDGRSQASGGREAGPGRGAAPYRAAAPPPVPLPTTTNRYGTPLWPTPLPPRCRSHIAHSTPLDLMTQAPIFFAR